MARIKKRYFVLGFLSLFVFVILFFLSTFTKNYLVKNSEKLIGRRLEIGELHFNYARIALQVKDFTLFEDNKTDSFISFNELYINFDPWKLLNREYSFSEIRLSNPKIQIVQTGSKFNFDSLKPKPDSIPSKDTTKNEILKFLIRNIQLTDGQINYSDIQKKSSLEMKNLDLNLPLIAWNNDKSNLGVNFRMGKNGKVNIQATVDNLKKKYQIDLTTQDIELQPITEYLKDYIDVQSINGLLTSKLKIYGEMNDVINVSLSGKGTLSDFSMIDGQSEKIISAPKVSVSIRNINLKKFHFGFGTIEAEQPNLLVVRDKKMTNLERLFLPYFRNDSIAAASAPAPVDVTPVNYSIDTIQVNNGWISISDKTLNRPFNYELNDLNVKMTGLTESAERIPVEFSAKLNKKGELKGTTVWSMADFKNIEMDLKVKRMELLSFSPYSEYYVASPITQGWFNYNLHLKMTAKSLDNLNGVKVDELEFGKRTKDTTAMKVPVRLGLYLMKDAKDQIKFDLPVTGNPSEPKFRLGKIIWKTFANLMVKTALSPFNAIAGLAGANPESMDKLPFTFAQDSLNQAQRDELTKLATIMKMKPKLILEFTQSTDPEKEKNLLAIQLTKEEFLAAQNSDPNASKVTTSALKDDDPNLLSFIRKSVPTLDSIGLEKACVKHLDAGKIETRFQTVLDKRNELVRDFLIKSQGIPSESVQVETADLKNLPEELKIPQFKIEVSIN